jgi:antagonist of KipI
MSMRVLAPGLLTSVQDLGRHGHSAIGVGTAGAMDPVALRLANMLVGNVNNAACLEMTLRGPRLCFETDALIALTGAPVDARCGGVALPGWCPVVLRAGAEVDFAGMSRGARTYLAIAGGIGIAEMLGSRSADINAGFGPMAGRALAQDDSLPTGANVAAAAKRAVATARSGDADTHEPAVAAKWSIDPSPWFDPDGPEPIALTRGAHFGRLDATSRQALFDAEFRIGSQSNRVGYRLGGPRLTLTAPLELISEGVAPGTLQLPPDGNLIALMAEAPTTGGYPRVAHVATVDLPRLAQRKPGDRIRFAQISLEEAQSRYLERERALARLGQSIAERLRSIG